MALQQLPLLEVQMSRNENTIRVDHFCLAADGHHDLQVDHDD